MGRSERALKRVVDVGVVGVERGHKVVEVGVGELTTVESEGQEVGLAVAGTRAPATERQASEACTRVSADFFLKVCPFLPFFRRSISGDT